MFFFGDDNLGSSWDLGIPSGWDLGLGTWGTPTVGGTGGNNINWQSVINQGFALGSQIIGAWGRNPTQQVGTGGILGVGGGYSPAAVNQSDAQRQAAIAAQLAAQRSGQPYGGQYGGQNSLDGIFSSITATISSNPLIFAAGAVGLYLLFREPPRRR